MPCRLKPSFSLRNIFSNLFCQFWLRLACIAAVTIVYQTRYAFKMTIVNKMAQAYWPAKISRTFNSLRHGIESNQVCSEPYAGS
jgi:hypothetical protein